MQVHVIHTLVKPPTMWPSDTAMVTLSCIAMVCVMCISSLVYQEKTMRSLTGRYMARDLDGGYSLVLVGEPGYKVGDWVNTSNDTIVAGSRYNNLHCDHCGDFEITSVIAWYKDKD